MSKTFFPYNSNDPIQKRHYWILMPPFFITMIILAFTLPVPYKAFSIIVIFLYWVTLRIWNTLSKKRGSRL